GFGIVELNAAQRCFEAFAGVKAGEHYGLVADEPRGAVDSARVAAMCSEVRLRAGNEEAASLAEAGQSLEIDISSIHDGEGAGLGHEVVEDIDVVIHTLRTRRAYPSGWPSLMKINDGMLPRRSSSVWSFTAAFVDRKGAQENTERHRSIVVESSAYTVSFN